MKARQLRREWSIVCRRPDLISLSKPLPIPLLPPPPQAPIASRRYCTSQSPLDFTARPSRRIKRTVWSLFVLPVSVFFFFPGKSVQLSGRSCICRTVVTRCWIASDMVQWSLVLDEIVEFASVIHDLLTSSLWVYLYKANYWYWHNKHCSVARSDRGLSLSARCFRSLHTHAHADAKAGLSHWLELFCPGKLMDDVCLLKLQQMCAHAQGHESGVMGWLARSHSLASVLILVSV